MVSKYISKFLYHKKFFSEFQYGFHDGLPTVTQLVETTHFLSEVLDRRGQIDISYLDFKTAFDTVSPQKVLMKLEIGLSN